MTQTADLSAKITAAMQAEQTQSDAAGHGINTEEWDRSWQALALNEIINGLIAQGG